ncbi:MAG: 30S ribosomal protein S4 [Patescibacteria group bacterium]
MAAAPRKFVGFNEVNTFMGRNLEPKHKLCRQYGMRLCDSPKCPAIKRPYRPGMHGPKGRQRISEYGLQLREKQKARKIYGILERQFRNYYHKAKQMKGDTGANLVTLLETRLDNVMYRLKIAKTRSAARQMVNHGHVLVNQRKNTIPSLHVSAGDSVQIKTKSITKPLFRDISKSIKVKELPSWLTFEDISKLQAKITGTPSKEELNQGFETAMIIEFYSR